MPFFMVWAIISAGASSPAAPGCLWAQAPTPSPSTRPGKTSLWGVKKIFGFPGFPGASQNNTIEKREEVLVGTERIAILRDSWGVPHVLAETDRGLFAGQGYVQAEDRLWQMELWRRFARGELAEIEGDSALETDIAMRASGLTEIECENNLRKLSPSAQSIYCASAKG